MLKFNTLLIALVAVGSTSAFAPSLSSGKAFVPKPLFAEESDAPTPTPAAAPVEEKLEEPASPAGALVPIKEETIEFTAGLIGGAVGFAVGGPVLGAITAAMANYASKTDKEIGEVVQAVSKSSIEVYNYLATLDAKYEVLIKAQKSLEDALEKVKSSDKVDPETVKKVETALASTTSKIKEINTEYDIVGAGQTALGVIGDLVEKAVKKAGELNEEYKLTDKAQDALKGAVDKAKAAAK
mmetsp:Transcript_5559/g.3371  ORF Transcript_5559/g.3371 Transcript_5559/m.3371 type:complete len:240 (+) Transcript_5559:75-794(+)|eukprot:CAMPEP_0203634556 /NCGR_PEP_ID=MMETSP0088-20131115/1456_1 /ASSEMBLY_ACC=CAM_ASM_001087 /TAXON_ID=426623 /ORGANISM="Chaetoceros affinis, Strain CCMP159" /LENGTH=239 /DNA_ID=CAMNT_0050488183 /DNA_START=70 /DNA_END=789 /DNA_ORIENTATION=-